MDKVQKYNSFNLSLVTQSLHGPESLKCWYSLTWSGKSLAFMEPESSFPCSQNAATGLCSESNPFCTFVIHFNVITCPCHHDMAHPRVPNEGDGVYMW
jgi:hypothetical protein